MFSRTAVGIMFATLYLFFNAQGLAQTGDFNPYPVFDGGGMRVNVAMRGQIGSDPSTRLPGWFWPGDGVSSMSSRALCYFSSPVFIGKVNGEHRVSVSHFRNSFLPGPIIGGRPADNPTDPLYRAYTITNGETASTDYREWPAALGAPAQTNGAPYFYGRKQMFWVMNDLDTAAMQANNGTLPLGLEMRCLLYEPWPGAAREDALLLQVTYINKGPVVIEDAYAGYYMDMDVRDGVSDLAGSDSLRGMVYAYDSGAGPEDEGMPVAFGLVMLQTPTISAPGERARWFAGWKQDAQNIPITAAVLPIKTSPCPIREPVTGSDVDQWHGLMRGQGSSDVYAINPRTGVPSRFWVSGDPVSMTGWLQSSGISLSNGQNIGQQPNDKRVLISAGPFDLAPGDTQQVTYAFIATRGASPHAAIHALRDHADFLRADFMQRPIAAAYRLAEVQQHLPATVPGQINVSARFADIPVDLNVEVSDGAGNVLIDAPLDRSSSGNDWVYGKTVSLPEAQRQGVNISFVASWDGARVRIPGRVSFPVSGSIDMDEILMLDEGDNNGRVAPDEEAIWFPRFVNRTPYSYSLFAQTYYMPDAQWLRIPAIDGNSSIPSAENRWIPSMGYNTVWDSSLITSSEIMEYRYDLYDPLMNVWWERTSTIPTDSTAGDWYDVLMTQVRGTSDERPGVRLVDLAALRDNWYVASINGSIWERTISLHDSATGVPYFTGFGLDMFSGAAPLLDGFRTVRGTITKPGINPNTATEKDLYIFNPRHVLLARSRKPAINGAVSYPSPQPLTAWTTVTMDVPEATLLRAEVYNAIGQRVKILREEFVQPGRHLLIWDGYWSDGRPADSGAYLLRIVTRSGEVTRKVMLLR